MYDCLKACSRIFAKFQPEKYDFDLYERSPMKKNGPNLPDFKDFFNKNY